MSRRPSYEQMEALVEFLERNPEVAKGLLRTAQGKVETKRKWMSLATTLNALGGANKDGQGWAKYWAEKKCALKKNCAQLAASMRRTGGGPADPSIPLSNLDQRLVSIMGGHDFATGDSRLAVDPFPHSSNQDPLAVPLEIINTGINLETSQTSPLPSTSHDLPILIEDNRIPTPPATSAAPQETIHPRTRQSRHRPRESNTRSALSTEMDRLASIEERRVEAELITARALSELSNSFQATASELHNIGNALAQIARGLEGLAMIANAILEVANMMPRNSN